ncbi:MAG TPA: hypothetical protein DCM40_17865, partial [Maribacter sp.]|nr:hypothetical protein [Maribacter sp.]
CEENNINIAFDPNNAAYPYTHSSTSEDWIRQYDNTVLGKIHAQDPFRAKLQLFWKLQGPPDKKNISELKSFHFGDPSDPPEEESDFNLPIQISDGIQMHHQSDSLEVRLSYPNLPSGPNKISFTHTNPYNVAVVEFLDFIVRNKP